MRAEPWRERGVRTRDGLELCVREWGGDAAGPALIVHHGSPSSRLWCPGTEDDRRALGQRVVTFDRPGFGRSAPRPGRTIADGAANALAIADALGLERFAVCGWSGGGPHALACAAILPERVTRALTLGAVAPADDPAFDFVAGMPEPSVVEFRAAMEGRQALARLVEPHLEHELALDEWLDALPSSDRAILRRPGMADFEAQNVREACRQGAAGWLDDDLAVVSPWGFALEAVAVPVRIWQGQDDVLVPAAHARYLADRIPGARLELVPGAGHWLDDHHRAMLAWLAGES